MSDFRDLLFGKAFQVIPGDKYNNFLRELSGDPDAPQKDKLIYEVVIKGNMTWEEFRDQVYPSYVRYMKAKSLDPESPKNVVVSVFFGNRCLLLNGRDFVGVLKDMDGLNASALHFRVLRWLSE